MVVRSFVGLLSPGAVEICMAGKTVAEIAPSTLSCDDITQCLANPSCRFLRTAGKRRKNTFHSLVTRLSAPIIILSSNAVTFSIWHVTSKWIFSSVLLYHNCTKPRLNQCRWMVLYYLQHTFRLFHDNKCAILMGGRSAPTGGDHGYFVSCCAKIRNV